MKNEPALLNGTNPTRHARRTQAVVKTRIVRRPCVSARRSKTVDDTGGVDGPIHLDGEASRVNSSITLGILRVRPLAVVSNWSIAQITFGRIGDIAPTATPIPVSRFLRRRCGPRKPSSRHSRRMRLLLATAGSPRHLRGPAPPQRGRSTENWRSHARSSASSVVIGAGVSRSIVERCKTTTEQARRLKP